METKAHSRLAPSSSKSWLICPGSINLCEQIDPEPENIYAATGTAAHSIAEQCLMQKKEAAEFVGVKVKTELFEIEITPEIANAVQIYVDEVRSHTPKDGAVLIEYKVSLDWIHPDIGGTSDAIIYDPAQKKIKVFDYKNGVDPVDVDHNTQLMIYGIGAIKALHDMLQGKFIAESIDTVELFIVQPNASHHRGPIRSWEISINDLKFWALHVLRPCAHYCDEPDAICRAGSHCKWCDAKVVCDAFNKKALAVAKADFETRVLPDPADMTPEDWVKILDMSELIFKWKEQAIKFIQSKMEAGVYVPGKKLVEGKANRRWKENAEEEIVRFFGSEAAYEKKLIGITKVETLLKSRKLNPAQRKEYMNELCEKPVGKPTIADESDPRPAIGSTALDFLDTEDFMQ